MKSAPRIAGLFFVDQRQFRKDMHAAVDYHEAPSAEDGRSAQDNHRFLESNLRSYMKHHTYRGDPDQLASAIVKLCVIRNHNRARKLLNNGIPDTTPRLWAGLLWGLVCKLFWPTLAVLVGLSIYHMVVS